MSRWFIVSLVLTVGLLVVVEGCQEMAAEMSEGERLYRSKCSSCHSTIEPERFGKEQWREHIDRFGKKMTAEEKDTVLEYLTGEGR